MTLTAINHDSFVDRIVENARHAAAALTGARVPHRLVGGVAVLFHMRELGEDAEGIRQGADFAVEPGSLPAVHDALTMVGYTPDPFSPTTFLQAKRQPAIHIIFTDSSSLEPAQAVDGVATAPVADLVRMKLTSYRLKDKVHIQDMDGVGLITPEIEASLSEPLRQRLAEVRAQE